MRQNLWFGLLAVCVVAWGLWPAARDPVLFVAGHPSGIRVVAPEPQVVVKAKPGMASQGPSNPGTLADDATVGTVAWVNPSNAASSDNVYSTFSPGAPSITSHYLKATNFGFSVSGTINGIVVEIERKWNGSGPDARDSTVKLVIGGTVSGDNKATGTTWPTSDAYATYGGVSDLWGLTPTAAQVNASDFGVVLSAFGSGSPNVMSVDHIRITVYYTPVSSGQVSPMAAGGSMYQRTRVVGY